MWAAALVLLLACAGRTHAQQAPDSAATGTAPAPPPAEVPVSSGTAESADNAAPATPSAARSVPAPTAKSATPARPAPESPAPAAAVSAGPVAEPTNLHDLTAWLEYRRRNHLASLPHEARLFYRQGLLARESGDGDVAARLVRGASELDPAFVAPHLTLASWALLHDPSQSLLQYATVLELARGNFMLQLALLGNAIYIGLQALFLGLLATGLLIVAVHVSELRHPWHEQLALWLKPETARWWSWAFVVLPFLTGFGPVLPTLAFLGLLWHVLKARERLLFIVLLAMTVSVPWTTAALDRLATPLNEERGPLYGVPVLDTQPWTPESLQRIETLATQNPDNPYLAFGLAWMQRRGGQLAAAEASYRHTLERRPNDDRALNNLGNVLAMQGRSDEALELYLRATRLNPSNPAAFFNASQIYTQRFEYRSATDALAHASALDFEMVKSYQSESSTDGMLALVDQWVAPETFWKALPSAAPVGSPLRALPPSWRTRIEVSGWRFSAIALAVALLGLVWGVAQQRRWPLRNCGNCGKVVCRRCAQRRREIALCRACATLESRAESPDFARVLLLQYQRRTSRASQLLRTALATLLPGYGLLCFRHVFAPVMLLTLTAALFGGTIGMAPPFSYESRLRIAEQQLPVPVTIALWVFVYLVSIVRYFGLVASERDKAAALAAPVRSRTVQPTRRTTADAA